jgi:hypothetical protein
MARPKLVLTYGYLQRYLAAASLAEAGLLGPHTSEPDPEQLANQELTNLSPREVTAWTALLLRCPAFSASLSRYEAMLAAVEQAAWQDLLSAATQSPRFQAMSALASSDNQSSAESSEPSQET